MKHYELDPKALLGGVIASDGNQEIVQAFTAEGIMKFRPMRRMRLFCFWF